MLLVRNLENAKSLIYPIDVQGCFNKITNEHFNKNSTVLTALHNKHLFIYNSWSIIVYPKQLQQIKEAKITELYTGHEKEF